jgi:hypothetical protein
MLDMSLDNYVSNRYTAHTGRNPQLGGISIFFVFYRMRGC